MPTGVCFWLPIVLPHAQSMTSSWGLVSQHCSHLAEGHRVSPQGRGQTLTRRAVSMAVTPSQPEIAVPEVGSSLWARS